MRTNICLCPCECSHLEPLCIHTYVTNIHILHHRYLCISTRAVRSHTCTCHCECSQLEPLRIHAYTHKYTYIIPTIILYVNPCRANSHMSVALRVLALRTSLHTYMCSQVYIYSITDTFIYEPRLGELTYMFVPLRVPTL